jgi:hypothetical protein
MVASILPNTAALQVAAQGVIISDADQEDLHD